MLDAIREFFSGSMQPDPETEPRTEHSDLRLAACALLLEMAWADDEFTEEERDHLHSAVRRHWGLGADEADQLIAMAEKARSEATDLYQFTRLIRENYSLGQKMVLAEIMWGLVFADGDLSSREDYLIRKVSGLLDLRIAYLSEARNRVRGAAGAPDGPFVVD
jgi:uncharacterized tellurite resistance protein B-like protein